MTNGMEMHDKRKNTARNDVILASESETQSPQGQGPKALSVRARPMRMEL